MPAARLLAALVACGNATLAMAQAPQGPSAIETNKFIQVHNAYRNLIAASLLWKSPASEECKSIRFRLATVARPIPVLDPGVERPNDESWINLQQRSEENSMTQTAVIGPLVVEALAMDCLRLPLPEHESAAHR